MKIRRPKSLTFFALVTMINGLVMMAYTQGGLLDFSRTTELLSQVKFDPYLSYLFFYQNVEPKFLSSLLGLRLVLAIAQILTGLGLLKLRSWALSSARLLTIAFLTGTFLNPMYPDYFSYTFIFYYSYFLFFLHHQRVENLCTQRDPDSSSPLLPSIEKSKLAVLFASIETITGLGLIKSCFWKLPLSGLTIDLMDNFHIPFVITAPKTACIFFAILVFTAGILTLSFKPIGRMLSILFCTIAFISCGLSVFIIDKPASMIGRFLALFVIAFTLFLSLTVFFLLTNPTVKAQFQPAKNKKTKNGRSRFLSLLGFGAYSLVILAGLQVAVDIAPQAFAPIDLSETTPSIQHWQDSPLNERWQKSKEKALDLYRRIR